MKTLAVYSIKGGVGKTAAAVNLSYLAATEGRESLLCDLDSQGSASYYFRIRPARKFNSKRFLKGSKDLERAIRGTDYDGLDLLPGSHSFRNLDLRLDALKKSKQRLAFVLKRLASEYDLIILDAPPNLTLLAENIFHAADHILVPCIPTTLAMLSYERLLTFFKSHRLDRKKLLPFFSMVEVRKRLHKKIMAAEDRRQFLSARIPYLADIEKMGEYRTPVAYSNPNSPAAQAYRQLWQEISPRLT